MRSQPGGNRFVRPGGAGVGPGAIRAETGGDYVSVVFHYSLGREAPDLHHLPAAWRGILELFRQN